MCAELHNTRTELHITRTEVHNARNEVHHARTELHLTRTELHEVRNELQVVQQGADRDEATIPQEMQHAQQHALWNDDEIDAMINMVLMGMED